MRILGIATTVQTSQFKKVCQDDIGCTRHKTKTAKKQKDILFI